MQPSDGGNTSELANVTLQNSTGAPLHLGDESDVLNGVQERPHRSQSLREWSSTGGSGYSRDGIVRDARQTLASRLNSHERKRRNSLSILISARNTGARVDIYPKPQVVAPTKSAFPPTLPIAQERQTDLDLENFRLARACGMTLDTISVSKPRAVPLDTGEQTDNIEDADRRSSKGDNINESTDTRQSNQDKGNACLQECEGNDCSLAGSPLGNVVIPIAGSAPSSPTSSSKKPDVAMRSSSPIPPPVAPVLDPKKQLACINAFWNLHRDIFDAGESLEALEALAIENLIDVRRLLVEHEVDKQFEDLRRDLECTASSLDVLARFQEERVNEDENIDTHLRLLVETVDLSGLGNRVFGEPLSHTRIYASCACSLAGYQHDLPIVVHACVEELYRTGMTVPGLFRSPPDRTRHGELIEMFDTAPSFGRGMSLGKERTADVCALLRSYIDRLPRPVWHEALFDPMLKFCVRPSLLAEKALAEASDDDEVDRETDSSGSETQPARSTSLIIPTSPFLNSPIIQHVRASSLDDFIPFSNSLSSPTLSTMARSEVDIDRETPQIAVARALFRLLPRAQLALLAYLCAFFTQLPLCPHNQLAIEDIARLFAVPLFLGKVDGDAVPVASEAWATRKEEARQIMVWILKRWAYICEGLFDPDDPEGVTAPLGTAENELMSGPSTDDSDSVQTASSTSPWNVSELSVSTCSSQDVPKNQRSKTLTDNQPESLESGLSGKMDVETWNVHVEVGEQS